jgi:asparagine synthase (glutamine-hydrolysing)
VPGAREPRGIAFDDSLAGEIPDFVQRMQFFDSVTYLPDDILTKVDRASMAVSLEARVPLLDHRVVELVWRLPQTMKVRGGTNKWLLREVLYRYVPREVLQRPKMGFSIPTGRWLRGPLRDWAEALLAPQRLAEFFDVGEVRAAWSSYLAGRNGYQEPLWGILMFQEWHEFNANATPQAAVAP